jgi:hypothetical protein
MVAQVLPDPIQAVNIAAFTAVGGMPGTIA